MTPAGQCRLLAHYAITAGPRGLYAQRIDGRVALVDAPLDPDSDGRVYLVERHVASQTELEGLCSAYIEHSERADRPGIEAQRAALTALTEDHR